MIVLPTLRTSSIRSCDTYPVKVGTSAATIAPSKIPKRTTGIVEALRNASSSERVP